LKKYEKTPSWAKPKIWYLIRPNEGDPWYRVDGHTPLKHSPYGLYDTKGNRLVGYENGMTSESVTMLLFAMGGIDNIPDMPEEFAAKKVTCHK